MAMSDPTPYQTLGVSEDASFEEIQAVKNHLSQQYQGDTRTLELVETAYDAILMDRLKLRQEGKIKVPDRFRFPERSVETAPKSLPSFTAPTPSWLQGWLDQPSRQDILLPGIIFLILGIISFVSPNGANSLRPLLLVAGVFVSIYFLNRKENKFGRAFLLTLGSLILGVALGSGLTYLLKNSNLPISGEQVAATMSFVLLWLTSSFLR